LGRDVPRFLIMLECFESEIHNIQLEKSKGTYAVFVALQTTLTSKEKEKV